MTLKVLSAKGRQFGRRDCAIQATIVVPGRSSQACTIRNYSQTGALIELDGQPPTAHMFRLIILKQSIDLLCQVRHRAPTTLGIAFAGGTMELFLKIFHPPPLITVDQFAKGVFAVPAKSST